MKSRIQLFWCCLVFAGALPSTSVLSDPYDVAFRDFIVIREQVEACMSDSVQYSDVSACAGKATLKCQNPNSDWPYPMPRDCKNESDVWADLYQIEVMRKLAWGREFDEDLLRFDMSIYAGALFEVMEAELAWSDFASAQCGLELLNNEDLSYEYQLAHPAFCAERLYAERIFYLRSQTDMLPRTEP